MYPLPGTTAKRLFSKIDFGESADSCWVFTGCIQKGGYGRIGTVNGSVESAHRASYEVFKGPIPDGLHIDHLCRNRACCNPQHMEAVTQRENTLRGVGATALNSMKSLCKNGHPLPIAGADGQRKCLVCKKEYARAYNSDPIRIEARKAYRRQPHIKAMEAAENSAWQKANREHLKMKVRKRKEAKKNLQ